MAATPKILAHTSYLPLLAFFASHVVSPFAGATVLYFHTVYAAGLCGYALAERRQRNGAEKSATIAVQLVGEEHSPVLPATLSSALSLACAMRVLRVSFGLGPGDAALWCAICDFSFMLIVCLYFWTLFVCVFLLKEALFCGHNLGMLGLNIFVSCFLGIFAVAIFFGEAVASVVPCLTAMAMAGLLGYTLAVYHKYEQLQLAIGQATSYQS